jgi:hypothetical protein
MLECYISQYMHAEYKMDMQVNSFRGIAHIKRIISYSNKSIISAKSYFDSFYSLHKYNCVNRVIFLDIIKIE